MVPTQYLCHFLDGLVAQFFCQSAHHDAAEEGLCRDTFHHGRVGSNHHVVLIHAPIIVAFGLQDAYDAERNAFEADDLADAIGILAAEEFLHDGGTDDTHLGALHHVFFRKAVATLDVPELDGHVVGALAIHRAVGILGAIDDLAAA